MFTRNHDILDLLRKPAAATSAPSFVGAGAGVPAGAASGGRRRGQRSTGQQNSRSPAQHQTGREVECPACGESDRPYVTTWLGSLSTHSCVHCGHAYRHFGLRRTVFRLWLVVLGGTVALLLLGALVMAVAELSIR